MFPSHLKIPSINNAIHYILLTICWLISYSVLYYTLFLFENDTIHVRIQTV